MTAMNSKFKARNRYIAVFLLAMAVVHGFEFWQQRTRIFAGYGDFSALYTSGLLLRRGEGSSLYDRQKQWEVQQQFALNVDIRQGPMPFIRPPFEALVFLPLAFFSYRAALMIWVVGNVILLWLTLKVLPQPPPFISAYSPGLQVVLLFGFFPVFLDLFQAQDAIVLLFILASALNRMAASKDLAAGAIMSLGLFKFHLVIPIVVIIWLAGRVRVLAGFVPTTAVLVVLSGLISGWGVLKSYPAYLLSLNQASGGGMVKAQSMPNLRGLLTAFLGRVPYPGRIHWLLLPIAIAAIVFTARRWRPAVNKGYRGLALGYCLALVVAILTSYYAYPYDMTLLVIPLVLLGGEFINHAGDTLVLRRPVAAKAIACALLLLICSPLYWALILHFNDRPYLLVIPMFILACGIAAEMQRSGAVPAFDVSH